MGDPTAESIRGRLSQHVKRAIADPSLTAAAVMLILYPKYGEYRILLNKRTESVQNHKGEISFPGGVKDDMDASLLQTALRETHEEMGIEPGDVDLLGELDDEPTVTGYVISPYVGTIPGPYEFSPSDVEVAEVLEVPLSALCDGSLLRDEVRLSHGELLHSPCYSFRGHIIFGATARILARFLGILGWSSQEELSWTRN